MMLKGKKGIISGALDESSIAWKVAERCHEEGAIFTLTNAPMAMRMGKINELGEKCNSKIVGAWWYYGFLYFFVNKYPLKSRK